MILEDETGFQIHWYELLRMILRLLKKKVYVEISYKFYTSDDEGYA